MTKDEILNMPAGREMDRFIVEYVFSTEAHMKDYSTDLSAAFEVIQKMHEMKYRYALRGHFRGGDLHIAAFDDQDWADSNPLYNAIAATVPLAICRAALLAVMK